MGKINLDNYLEVTCFYNFQAPNSEMLPRQITNGFECVEIITNGKIIDKDSCGNEKVFGAGTIFWHREQEFTIHKTPSGELYQCLVVEFRVKEKQNFIPRIGFWDSPCSLELFIKDAMALFANDSNPKDIVKNYILSNLLRQQCINRSSHNKYPESLTKALQLISEKYSGDLLIDDLAKECCISKTQLFRLFKKYLQVTPHKYVMNYRLEIARNLLLSSKSEFPIKLVAEVCGYNNIEVFYRNFKSVYGESPHEYRVKNYVDKL